jgi:hypothetical protein
LFSVLECISSATLNIFERYYFKRQCIHINVSMRQRHSRNLLMCLRIYGIIPFLGTTNIRKRIDAKLTAYATNGSGDVKRLKGGGGRRLRVGVWRATPSL